jgi:UDP-galactopyranose mutase
MLKNSDVLLNTDYFDFIKGHEGIADKILFTGPIDAFFEYKFGALEYRSVRFENKLLDIPNFQGNAVVNYTSKDVAYTRIIEHKHFEFGTQEKTYISYEYPCEWKLGIEPYYPINNEKNNELLAKYEKLVKDTPNVIFGGRLGLYKYLDMDKVIEAAISLSKKVID